MYRYTTAQDASRRPDAHVPTSAWDIRLTWPSSDHYRLTITHNRPLSSSSCSDSLSISTRLSPFARLLALLPRAIALALLLALEALRSWSSSCPDGGRGDGGGASGGGGGQGVGHFALHCECPGSTSLCTELHAIVHSHTISGLFSQGSSPVWATVGHARRSTEIVSILSFIMLGQTRGRSSSSVVSGWRTSGVYSLQSSTECEGAERPRGDGRSGAAACGVAGS